MIKKYAAMLFLIGIWLLAPLAGAADAVEDPLLAAGFLSPNETQMAPSFSLDSIEGTRIDLDYFRHRVVLVFFWTTW